MIWPQLFPADADTPAVREAAAHSSCYQPPLARKTDPSTSHAAAADAKRGADTLRARCLSALRELGERGCTDFELADLVGSQQTSAGKRRGELVAAGLVVNSGRTAPAPSGSQAIIWIAVP